MRILIIGGAGFIGSHTADALLRDTLLVRLKAVAALVVMAGALAAGAGVLWAPTPEAPAAGPIVALPASGPLITVMIENGCAVSNPPCAFISLKACAAGNSGPTDCTKMSTAPSQPSPRPHTVSSSDPVS